MIDRLTSAVQYIRNQTDFSPEIVMILGTSFDDYIADQEIVCSLDYREIPGFPESKEMFHAGKLWFTKIAGKNTAILQGRYHCYEGYSAAETTIPLRVMRLLGAKTAVLTNAAGGINPNFRRGDLMLLSDHINFTDRNALTGKNVDELGPRFCDMSTAYTPDLQKKMLSVAKREGILLHSGVYAYMPGPSFETPAEIRALKVLGADAVGMSTVHEAVAASHAGMALVALSCISNLAAGISSAPLSNEEVVETLGQVKESIRTLLDQFLKEL